MNSHSMHKKQGKRISMEDLYKFIKTNNDAFQNIGCVNLNNQSKEPEELEKLQFQDVRKIQTLPNTIANFLQFDQQSLKYLHAGTFVKTKGSMNLSLFSSVITCLRRSFLSQTIISQEKFLISLIDRFKSDLTSLFFLHKYDKIYNWSKEEVISDINNGIFSGQILHILCDYFCVNIFVLDIEDDSVFFGGGMHYIPYRKSIFVLKYDNDIFEPLFTEQTRLFTLSDEPVKSIRSQIRNTKLYSVYGYGVSKPEEFEEDLIKYNPPIKKSKRELLKEKQKMEQEKLKDENKENDELENILDKIDEELSDKIANEIAEYDDTINGFTDDKDNESEQNVEEIIEKKPSKKQVKQSKKMEWIIQDEPDEKPDEKTDEKPEEKKPTKKQKVNSLAKPHVDVTTLKTMKLVELQETATKLGLSAREGGKALVKQQLLNRIENYLTGSIV